MTTNAGEVPVLIVGGGPAGLTASLLLSRHGIQTLLVDKHATVSPLPRARGVHARAMEILRVCGVEADLRRLALPISPGAEWRPSLTGPPVREDVPGAAVGDELSPCEGLAISQDVLESLGDPVVEIRGALGVPDLPIEVLASSSWNAAAQTATRYAHGPVFLTGDAAHRFPPAGATGVSAAMPERARSWTASSRSASESSSSG